MAILRPFRALRPVPARAAAVAAVPYDVVNREESLRLAEGNPWSFLHVSRPEIDLPPEMDPYSDRVYAKAKSNLDKLISECPLIRDDSPRIYLYRLRRGDHVQTGIAATYSIDEYDSNLIKKHERTRKDKEDDRTRHVLTLEAQTGPVFLAFRRNAAVAELMRQATAKTPLYDFTAPDGIVHTLWSVDSGSNPGWVKAFSAIPSLYIADGHHRAASASRARAEYRAKNPGHTGSEDYNFVLAVAFPAEELRILPYNRVVKDLAGMTSDGFLQALSDRFEASPDFSGRTSDPNRGEFALYLKGSWYRLKPRTPPPISDPIGSLDVSILQDQLLDPVLGIRDPRTDKRIDFVGGIRGTAELVRLVDSGEFSAAFSMHPTTLEDLMKVSDAGEIMPPKSTWFEPKLRDGLVSHVIAR